MRHLGIGSSNAVQTESAVVLCFQQGANYFNHRVRVLPGIQGHAFELSSQVLPMPLPVSKLV